MTSHREKTAEKTVRIIASKSCPTCNTEYDAASDHKTCPNDQTLLCPVETTGDIGLTVGNYEIVAKIGEGSSGQVFSAVNAAGEKAAVKLLKFNLLSDPVAVRRFQQEAEAVSELSHPYIAPVREYGLLPDGRPFIIMDYVGPTNLAELIASKGRIEPGKACILFLQIINALEAAHSAGIVHRDIKPSNIMIDEQGNIRVVDFGIAKIQGMETTATVTRTGASVGTPAYMSPEQCFGRDLDARSDIYSLGCLMFECLSGKKVFPAENSFLCMNQHSCDPPPQLSKMAKNLPPMLSQAVMICLAKSPEHRFQSMSELKTVMNAVSKKETEALIEATALISKYLSKNVAARSTAFGGFVNKAFLLVLAVVVGAIIVFVLQIETSRTPVETNKEIPVKQPTSGRSTPVFEEKLEAEPHEVNLLKKQFSEIEKEIARMKTANQLKQAEDMKTGLETYKNLYEKALTKPAFNGMELHSLAVRKGYGGITALRFSHSLPGTVTVKVSYTHNPLVLLLYAENPVTWKIDADAGVKIARVIATGPNPQGVDVQNQNPKIEIFDPEKPTENQEWFLPLGARFAEQEFEKLNALAMTKMKGQLVSAQNSETARETLFIGPESDVWRAQHVLWRMRDFYKDCMKSRDQKVADNVQKLVFDGAVRTGDGFMEPHSHYLGQLTPLGPVPSTLKKLDKASFLGAVSASPPTWHSSKIWYLLGDDRSDAPSPVAQYDPSANKVTPILLPGPKDESVPTSFRGITYDTRRNHVICLADGDDVPLVAYDVLKKKWLHKGKPMPYGTQLVGISYCPEDDTVYALGVHLLENPYRLYIYQIRDGALVKKTPASSSFCELQSLSSMYKVQLQIVGPYMIALGLNPYDMNPEGKPVAPICAVYDRTSGKLLFMKTWSIPKSSGGNQW